MAAERRKPLKEGTEILLKKEDGSESKLTIERVICYGENSISYIGKMDGIEAPFPQKAVIKELYPAAEIENGVCREQALFKKEFPFIGAAEANGTLYAYTDPNEIMTLREWKESGRPLAGKVIARIMSSVCGHIQKIHNGGGLYLNCSPDSIYLLYGNDTMPGKAYLFDFVAVKSKKDIAGYQYHSYMDGWAPIEQVYGEKRYIDVQADVYAAGAVFLWMLTGKTVSAQADHDESDSSFLWENYSEMIENTVKGIRVVRNIIMKSLHNAYSARYVRIADMKKDFDKLIRKYDEEKIAKANVKSVAYENDGNTVEIYEVEAEEKGRLNVVVKEEKTKDMLERRDGHYYVEGVHFCRYPNGDSYDGEWRNGKFHGFGLYQWENGDAYEGSWENGFMSGRGQLRYADGILYEGDWSNGKPEGTGRMQWPGGTLYEGEWFNGMRGTGRMQWPDGAVYEGSWAGNELTGKGKFQWPDGAVYEGEWLNSKREGMGRMQWPDGEVYEGSWLAGKRSGTGKDYYVGGDIYEGEFQNDKREGTGKYQYADGGVYEGGYLNGKRSGTGKFQWPDGIMYEGDWLNGKREGMGRMQWPGGEAYEGKWNNDVIIKISDL